MAFTIGTAANIRDLLAKFRSFVTTNGWQEVFWDGSTDLRLRGTGDNGHDEIYNRIYITENASIDLFNFGVEGYLGMQGIEPARKLRTQFCALWNHPMPYWIVCNGRRAMLFVKVSTKYACLHIGFVRPFGTPEQYPYPMIIGGTHYTNISWTNASNASFWRGHARLLSLFTSDNRAYWHPGGPQVRMIGGHTHNINCLDGSYVLFAMVVFVNTPVEAVASMGQIEGLYHIPGHNLSPESTAVIGADTYVVFPDFEATGRMDWCALQLK